MISQRPPMTMKEALRLWRRREDSARRAAAAERRAKANARREAERKAAIAKRIEDRVRTTIIRTNSDHFGWEAKIPRRVRLNERRVLSADPAAGFDIIPIPQDVPARRDGEMRQWVFQHLMQAELGAA